MAFASRQKREIGEVEDKYNESFKKHQTEKLIKKTEMKNVLKEKEKSRVVPVIVSGDIAEDNENDEIFVRKPEKKKPTKDSVTIKFPKKVMDNPELISMFNRTKTTPNVGPEAIMRVLEEIMQVWMQ